jgi:DNA-binding NarL/FixJ family response regulator
MSVVSQNSRSRILVVDEHALVRKGLTALLGQESDLDVCGTAGDASSGLEQVEALKPDLVILEIAGKRRRGLDLLQEIKARWPQQRVLVFSTSDESLFAPRSLRLGAAGYVMKNEPTATLLSAIRRVLNGDVHVSPRIATTLLETSFRTSGDAVEDPLGRLSPRELQVFRLIGQGNGTTAIATALGLSVKTVETHRAHIKDKLALKSGTDLVRHAVEIHGTPGRPDLQPNVPEDAQ